MYITNIERVMLHLLLSEIHNIDVMLLLHVLYVIVTCLLDTEMNKSIRFANRLKF